MGIYKDWQIHAKTGFRPIKLQEIRSGPHTNWTSYNNFRYWPGNQLIIIIDNDEEFDGQT